MQATRDMHTCYFSKKCRFCQAFFGELAGTPYTKEIRFICVDPSPGRPPLPAWLKSVPTLVVAGEDSPRVGPSAVNNWLFERKLLAGGGGPKAQQQQQQAQRMPEPISSNTPASSKQGPPILPNSAMEGGIEAWHGAEMSGGAWSDEYSYLDDPFTSDKGYNPITRNWEPLAGAVAPPIQRGGSHVGGGGGGGHTVAPPKSAKEEKLAKDFEAFAKMRDMEFAPIQRQ